jgi:pimeloyl-ACP methyl ester carboxylesterase
MATPAESMQPTVEAPRWFTDALAVTPEERTVEVAGTPIRYLRWGDTAKPGIVLVHGGAAHAHWWSFIAPQLTRQYHVVALDLSGHGESGRREEYPREVWADEVMGVADDARFIGPPVLVGHSLGGLVSIVAASVHGDRLAGAVIVDSPVRRPDPESEEGARGRAFRNPKVYPDLATAMQHFHLIPPQPCENRFIVEHIARHSLHRVPEGWTWKFDPRVFVRFSLQPMNDYLAAVRCRVAVFRGENSAVVPPETAEYMYELLDRNAPFVEIPDSYHHLILDQPLAFIAALRAILSDWQHSVPRRPRP